MKLKFSFLGTGTSQGVPLIGCPCEVCHSSDARDKRLRSSLLVQSEGSKLLIDAGPDLRPQLLRAEVYDIDALLITHQHQDHTAGLDELRAINFVQGHAIPIYCSAVVERRLREQYSYIFQNPDYPGIPQINFVRLPEVPFQIGDIPITPVNLLHADLPVTGFRFGDFAYCTDANFLAPAEKDKLRGLRHLVLNALRQTTHYSHFSLPQALALADELGAAEAYFTHISHQMGLHAAVQAELPAGRQLAYDTLQIEI